MGSRAGSSTLLKEWQKTTRVSAWKITLSRLEHSQHLPHLVSGLFNNIYNMKVESSCVAHHYTYISLTCSLMSLFKSSHDLLVVAVFTSSSSSFLCRWNSNLLAFNIILFVSPRCTDFVNHCVTSGCVPHPLFLEGFEYPQWSMILLSSLFHYLY